MRGSAWSSSGTTPSTPTRWSGTWRRQVTPCFGRPDLERACRHRSRPRPRRLRVWRRPSLRPPPSPPRPRVVRGIGAVGRLPISPLGAGDGGGPDHGPQPNLRADGPEGRAGGGGAHRPEVLWSGDLGQPALS